MARKKFRLAVLAFLACVITLYTQETLAFYSVVGQASNVVTSGNIRFIIHETTDQGTEFPQEGVYVVPGDIVSKVVRIESDCAHPFYLRVKPIYGIDAQELSAQDCFKLNIDEENWRLHDGWYYYIRPVQPGETTPVIFSEVEIVGSRVDNNYIGKMLTLTVSAQAVQSENNPVTGADVFTASGWPQE